MVISATSFCGKIRAHEHAVIPRLSPPWKVADCSFLHNLIAKKLVLPMFRLDAPVLLPENAWVQGLLLSRVM